MKSVISLGDMERRGMRMLEVACHKCERHGRLSRLIAEHGRDDHSDLCTLITHDCPRMQNPGVSIYERCGVMFHELPKRFLKRSR